MKKIRTLPSYMLLSIVIWSLFSGCKPDDIYQAAKINAHFRLQSNSALAGKVTIDEAFLKLREINITGNGESGHINIVVATPAEEPPYQLSKADSGQIGFTLPSRNFNLLDFHLYLLPDSYQLIVHEAIDPPSDGGGIDEPDLDEEGEGDDNTDPDNGEGTEGDGSGQGENDDGSNDDGSGGNDGDEDTNDGNGGKDDNDNGGEGDDDDGGEGDDDNDKDQKDKDDKDKKGKDKDKGKDNDDDDDDDNRENDDGRVSQRLIQAIDIDDFFQNAKPGLVVAATYQNNGKTFKLIFIGDNMVSISTRAKQNDSENVILNESNTADIVFSSEKWFQNLTPEIIESANIQMYQGQQVIFIHSKFNTALHEALTERFKESATLSISPVQEKL